MKALIFGLICSACVGSAATIDVQRPYVDLQSALGIQIYRFAVNLSPDEVLLVDEPGFDGKARNRWIMSAVDSPAVYEVSLLDGAAYSPKLRNTFTIKVPGESHAIEGLELCSGGNSAAGVSFGFRSPGAQKASLELVWTVRVLKYADLLKLWPGAPPPVQSGTRWNRNALRQ